MKLNTRNRLKIVSKTTTYTATTEDDVILVSDAGGSWTLTLPPAERCVNKVLQIKKTNSSSNTVTVDANSAELIDAAATYSMMTQYEVLVIVCDGSKWHILYSNNGILESIANSKLVTIRGEIETNGSIIAGEGFSSTNTSAGNYTITPSKAFAAVPTVVVSPLIRALTDGFVGGPNSTTAAVINIQLRNSSATEANARFFFFAIGPKW